MRKLSTYYQVTVKKSECWYFAAILRSFEHMSFDRTIDKANSIFEVMVSPGSEKSFLEIMDHFKEMGAVTNVNEMPNRLLEPNIIA